MTRLAVDGQGLLQGVVDLTRGLETISRRVSRSIDRAVRRLEGRAEPTLDKAPATKSSAAKPVCTNTLLAVDGLTLEAELAALEAIKNAANAQKTLDASRQLQALARDIVDLNRVVDAINRDSLDTAATPSAIQQDNRPAQRREPVMASSLPARVISFTEAARALGPRKGQRRQA